MGPKFRPISDFLQAQQANKPAKPKATAPVFYHTKALVGQPTRTPSSPRSCLAQLRAGSRPALHARLHRSDSTPARVSRLQLLRFCTSMLVTHQLTSPSTWTPPMSWPSNCTQKLHTHVCKQAMITPACSRRHRQQTITPRSALPYTQQTPRLPALHPLDTRPKSPRPACPLTLCSFLLH